MAMEMAMVMAMVMEMEIETGWYGDSTCVYV